MHGPDRWSRARRNVLALVLGLEALASCWLAIGSTVVAIVGGSLIDPFFDEYDTAARAGMGATAVGAVVVAGVCGLAAFAIGGRLGFERGDDRVWRLALVAAFVLHLAAIVALIGVTTTSTVGAGVMRWATVALLVTVGWLLGAETRLRWGARLA